MHLLYKYQKYICLECKTTIDLENEQDYEIDHFPSIFSETIKIWPLYFKQWKENSSKNNYEIKDYPLLKDFVVKAHNKIEFRLLHKECNQKLGKLDKQKEIEISKIFKKKYTADQFLVWKFYHQQFTKELKVINSVNDLQIKKLKQSLMS